MGKNMPFKYPGRKQLVDDVYAVVERYSPPPMLAKEVFRRVTHRRTGAKYESVKTALQRLRDAGRVEIVMLPGEQQGWQIVNPEPNGAECATTSKPTEE